METGAIEGVADPTARPDTVSKGAQMFRQDGHVLKAGRAGEGQGFKLAKRVVRNRADGDAREGSQVEADILGRAGAQVRNSSQQH
jgi:hypothetical protein